MSKQDRWSKFRFQMRRAVYLLVLIGLAGFLVSQGATPWLTVANHWDAALAVAVVSFFGYLIQALAFRECLPPTSPVPPLATILRIWALAGVSSLLAPLMASLAVRTILLQQAGAGLKAIGLATLRQTYLNIEYALILLAATLLIFPWPPALELGWALSGSATIIWLARRFLVSSFWPTKWWRPPLLKDTLGPPALSALPWLWGQIFIMALNYFASFNLTGASLAINEAVMLAALTILMSVAVFIPNGLGILDGLWVWLARHQGLNPDEAIALALILRLGNLTAAILLWIGLSVFKRGKLYGG